ncbi:hypothetical protein HMPREF9374_2040 [Desmospora sp. 8437]|nr:hypothetical protein HMPREF9374_2040 [Desmospora sp. 8437]
MKNRSEAALRGGFFMEVIWRYVSLFSSIPFLGFHVTMGGS